MYANLNYSARSISRTYGNKERKDYIKNIYIYIYTHRWVKKIITQKSARFSPHIFDNTIITDYVRKTDMQNSISCFLSCNRRKTFLFSYIEQISCCVPHKYRAYFGGTERRKIRSACVTRGKRTYIKIKIKTLKRKQIKREGGEEERETLWIAAPCLVRDSVGRMNSGETQRHKRRCESAARETKEILKDCHGNGCFGNRVLKAYRENASRARERERERKWHRARVENEARGARLLSSGEEEDGLKEATLTHSDAISDRVTRIEVTARIFSAGRAN